MKIGDLAILGRQLANLDFGKKRIIEGAGKPQPISDGV
jgi:hypothetical protein